jgi:biopolymer transport protein ExbD
MGEINTASADGKHLRSISRSKKRSIKIDLTPMVDLGFLLITFFIFSTVLSRPCVVRLNMPVDGDSSSISHSAVLTILAGKNNGLFYYQGNMTESLQNGSYGTTGYSLKEGIGEIIRQKQVAMDKYYRGGRKELMLLIKPSAEASYQNLVALLDEILINGVTRYAIVDISDPEKNLLEEKLHGH